MNPVDILTFLTPDFSDLLQASFFGVMLSMLVLTVVAVHLSASERAWEKKWKQASNSKSGTTQGIEQGGVTDLFHIVATRSEKLAEVMPGMLLIVGLLGTFIGLGLALDKASSILGASNAMDAAGAADGLQNMLGMLKGLGTKFKTSTWGIAGFILLKAWSEASNFEAKRMAWVIGKVKQESEARNAQQAAAEEHKWKQSMQLSGVVTNKLVAAMQAQTSILNEQQLSIAKSNSDAMQQLITLQTDLHSLLDRQARIALERNTENSGRQEALLAAMAKQHADIAHRSSSALKSLFDQQSGAVSEQDQQAQRHAGLLEEIIKGQSAAYALIQKQIDSTSQGSSEMRDHITAQFSALQAKHEALMEQGKQAAALQAISLQEQQANEMRENTRAIEMLGENMQRAADASQATNAAMQKFTENTEEVVSNMGDAADRMATGANNVGGAATDLLGAVNEFKTQFTEVLQTVRTDLGDAITGMGEKATETLEMGSRELSAATNKISESLEQLSKDVTGTMQEVQSSVTSALEIQKKTSIEFITATDALKENIGSATSNIEKLANPIEAGLTSISKGTREVKAAVKAISDGLTLAGEVDGKLTQLTSKMAELPHVITQLVTSLEPIKEVPATVRDLSSQLLKRPAAETGIARDINGKLEMVLSPLNDIQSLLLDLRTDLANRPVPQQGVIPEALLKDFSEQIQLAIANVPLHRIEPAAPPEKSAGPKAVLAD